MTDLTNFIIIQYMYTIAAFSDLSRSHQFSIFPVDDDQITSRVLDCDFRKPEIPNTSSIFLGQWHWSITPRMICYGHFVLWASVNLTHCSFKWSQWRKFSVKHRYNTTITACQFHSRIYHPADSCNKVAFSGFRACSKPNFIYFSSNFLGCVYVCVGGVNKLLIQAAW